MPGSSRYNGNVDNREVAMMTVLTVQSIKVSLDILSHLFVMRHHFNLEGGVLSTQKV